ncbi:MAG: MarR family transcriptional regulator [Xanthobacteraceae bacterium]|nr:MarR family transcriptional regulator [Xanthobacteraceae bacterium]
MNGAVDGRVDDGADAAGDLPHHESDGYLVRDAHRAFQRLLERRIAPHGVSRGQWYFLRVLWTKDGLSQRELSERVGMMEPTTVIALRSMEKAGLIRRVRSTDDRRVTHVRLTPKAKRMRDGLLKLARGINAQADAGISQDDIAAFRRVIMRMTKNLDKARP